MRIAHVVTYISADGAFGGPVAVAMAQAEELARRGHIVELLAGWDGVASVDIPGVTVRLFPVRRLPVGGFSGLFSLDLLRQFLAGGAYDVVHVHLARDLITLPVARLVQRRRRWLVVQPHGMVRPDRRLKARLFDALATRAVLRGARVSLALTEAEVADLVAMTGGETRTARIANGIPRGAHAIASDAARAPEVLFLARLHPVKRVMAFAEMARELISRGVDARFTVVGPDEGDLEALNAFIGAETLDGILTYEGALPPGQAKERLARADVYVLPSSSEVFPMTVLEAMASGAPVVITTGCGIAGMLAEREAALVTDGSVAELAGAVSQLLTDEELRTATVRNATQAVAELFSIEAVGEALLAHYTPAAASC